MVCRYYMVGLVRRIVRSRHTLRFLLVDVELLLGWCVATIWFDLFGILFDRDTPYDFYWLMLNYSWDGASLLYGSICSVYCSIATHPTIFSCGG